MRESGPLRSTTAHGHCQYLHRFTTRQTPLWSREIYLYIIVSLLFTIHVATRVIDHNVEHGGKHEEKKVMETLQGIVMTNAVQHDVNRDLQQITKGCDLYPPPLISDG